MTNFLGSLLAKAAVVALEALVAHLVQVLIKAATERIVYRPAAA